MASVHELSTATLGGLTESIAKELNECLCAIDINSSTCLRMLSADPPNVEGARETAHRTISCTNRAAEAVSRLHKTELTATPRSLYPVRSNCTECEERDLR